MNGFVFNKVASKIGKQASKEQGTARQAIKGFSGVLSDVWISLISIIPKMVRLTIELIKSKKVSDQSKLVLSGAVCVIGFSIAENIVSFWVVMPAITLFTGPFTAIISLFFYNTIKMILLTISFFIIAHTYNSIIENEEVEKLSKELFGDKESDEFLKRVRDIYSKLEVYLSPFINKLLKIFEKIEKKEKKTFDPDITGNIVARAAENNMSKLLGWSGSGDSCTKKLLTEGNQET